MIFHTFMATKEILDGKTSITSLFNVNMSDLNQVLWYLETMKFYD
jgi:hypothetical protein